MLKYCYPILLILTNACDNYKFMEYCYRTARVQWPQSGKASFWKQENGRKEKAKMKNSVEIRRKVKIHENMRTYKRNKKDVLVLYRNRGVGGLQGYRPIKTTILDPQEDCISF